MELKRVNGYLYSLVGLSAIILVGVLYGVTIARNPSLLAGMYVLTVPFLLSGIYTLSDSIVSLTDTEGDS